MKATDLTGQRFGLLTAVEVVAHDKYRMWKCQCDCGGVSVVLFGNLKYGNTKSCGCLVKRHGHAAEKKPTRTYKTWLQMNTRCRNPHDSCYQSYGARGIAVCERWLKFENFLADMGERPKGTSIDRIDPNGNYEPTNCRWATLAQQNRNKRSTRLNEQIVEQIRSAPRSETTVALAKRLGINASTAYSCRSGQSWCEATP